MAAGDVLLDALGNVILDDAGNVMLSDGQGDDCCCGDENEPHNCFRCGRFDPLYYCFSDKSYVELTWNHGKTWIPALDDFKTGHEILPFYAAFTAFTGVSRKYVAWGKDIPVTLPCGQFYIGLLCYFACDSANDAPNLNFDVNLLTEPQFRQPVDPYWAVIDFRTLDWGEERFDLLQYGETHHSPQRPNGCGIVDFYDPYPFAPNWVERPTPCSDDLIWIHTEGLGGYWTAIVHNNKCCWHGSGFGDDQCAPIEAVSDDCKECPPEEDI